MSASRKRGVTFICLTILCIVMIVMYNNKTAIMGYTVNVMRYIPQRHQIARGSCEDWNDVDWSKAVSPSIKLRKDKFLYPQLIWGPNNQINGLIQSMFLAIRLNRTLVLPLMHTDYKNECLRNYPTYQRVDVERVREFMTTISLKEMKERCGNTFDFAFVALEPIGYLMKNMIENTNITFTKRGTKGLTSNELLTPSGEITESTNDPAIPVFPLPSDIPVVKRFKKTTVAPDAPCALYVSAFNSINVTVYENIPTPLQESSLFDISEVADPILYSACTDAVRHPVPLVKQANEFITKVSKGKLAIAIHWRYDIRDWQATKCRNRIKDKIVKPDKKCNGLKQITPQDVLLGTMEKAKYVLGLENKTVDDIGVIYLAVPPALMETFGSGFIKASKQNFPSIKTITQINLKTYIDGESCLKAWQSPVEIVSLLEMEICTLSDIFYFSADSSWSKFVNLYRAALGNSKKFGVFDLASRAMIKRNLKRDKEPPSNRTPYKPSSTSNWFYMGDQDLRCSVRRISCVDLQLNEVNKIYYETSTSNNMTQSECLVTCSLKSSQFAGLYQGNTCVCIDSLWEILNDSNIDGTCDTPCAGDKEHTCGGMKNVELLQIISPCTKYNKTNLPETVKESYLGCVSQFAVPDNAFHAVDDVQCFVACEKRGFVLAAFMEDEHNCSCTEPTIQILGSTRDTEQCARGSTKIYRTLIHDARCGKRKFLRPNSTAAKVGLLSFPGSGNSWFRHLIESVSGVFTGSVYNDRAYVDAGMIGERLSFPSNRVAVTKTHGLNKALEKYIIIVRNPFDALMSEYKRIHAKTSAGGNAHVQDVLRINETALNAWAIRYVNTWYGTPNRIISSNKKPYLLVFYEEALKNATRVAEQMLRFLPEWSYKESEIAERLDCLYMQSTGNFKRSKTKTTNTNYFNATTTERINSWIDKMSDLLVDSYFNVSTYRRDVQV